MSVTVVFPLAHPTMSLVGRTCGVVPGPHDSTATSGAKVDVVRGEVVVDLAWCSSTGRWRST